MNEDSVGNEIDAFRDRIRLKQTKWDMHKPSTDPTTTHRSIAETITETAAIYSHTLIPSTRRLCNEWKCK